ESTTQPPRSLARIAAVRSASASPGASGTTASWWTTLAGASYEVYSVPPPSISWGSAGPISQADTPLYGSITGRIGCGTHPSAIHSRYAEGRSPGSAGSTRAAGLGATDTGRVGAGAACGTPSTDMLQPARTTPAASATAAVRAIRPMVRVLRRDIGTSRSSRRDTSDDPTPAVAVGRCGGFPRTPPPGGVGRLPSARARPSELRAGAGHPRPGRRLPVRPAADGGCAGARRPGAAARADPVPATRGARRGRARA